MNVLSLFDGMSCGQIALDKLGIKVNNYFASEIDKMYQLAIDAGAKGGKIAGAGGGGFLLLYVPLENQKTVQIALKDYREFPFMLEPHGSRIILNMGTPYWN